MGQQTTTPQPQATGEQVQGTRLEDDPAFKRLNLDSTKHQIIGMSMCGHVMDAGTFVDAHAQNASHEEAFVMRWLDPKSTTVHSALFMGRCVAKDGDNIDGKVIVRVLPNSLAISDRHALTAWEAEYWNNPAEQTGRTTPHRGAFSENRFVAELDPSKASEPESANGADRDLRWNEEQESLTLKPGVVLVPSPVHYTYQATPQPCVATAPKPSLLDKLKRHAEQTLQNQAGKADAQIAKGSGGNVDAGVQDTTTTAVNQANQPAPCTPVKGQPAKQ